ncbi:Gag-Pol polyprotein [Vitis vinifera]|uniref:Gag-Pol polyprotein n=1 Tax=Vitis vinifera TaxID=29760 RepID=A0A438GJI3_VITVI|nr:Gag-Pol polyprotein [Vitis vinifera]
MEEEAKPVRQPQRRLNPHMQEVVRAEVLKLLQAGPLPIAFIDQVLERVLAIHSTVSWMATGYFQIEIDVEDQEKTTFTCPLEPTHTEECLSAYAMHHNIPKMHVKHFHQLGSCLNRCIEKDLVLNWEKCHFMVHQGIVLGHIISKQGIEVDKAKVELIVKLPSPTTVKGVRQFLGHAGSIGAISDDRSIVRAPNWQLPFEVMCDASDFAIGAVLGKEKMESPIQIRAYLVGSFIVVFTDHSALKYLLTKQDKKRLIRWILLLQEFNLQIKDKKGVENVVADHLSRLAIAHNSHITREVPSEWKTQDKKHFFAKIHAYYWEEPFLFKYCADQIIRKIPCKRNDHRVVLKFLKENIFSRFGVPKAIISDGGTHFCNKPFETLLAKYGVKHKVATPYHPQTSGQVELANREIKNILMKSTAKRAISPWKWNTKLGGNQEANMDLSRADMKRFLDLNEMEELRNDTYNNSNIAKQRLKRWHDQYETRRPLTIPGATSSHLESSVHRTPTKRARTSGPGELFRPSQPDPRAPIDSQRLSDMEFFYPRVALDFYQSMTTHGARSPTAIHFSIDGRQGILKARHVAEALHIPYEPMDPADFKKWSPVSQRDMVHILSRGTSIDSVLLRKELPPGMLLVDVLLRPTLSTTTIVKSDSLLKNGHSWRAIGPLGAPPRPAPPVPPQAKQTQQDELPTESVPPAPAARMPEGTYTASPTTLVVPPDAPSTSEAFITISATEFRTMIQQHLGLLPPPQPDIPGPSEPITPVKETILVEKTTRADVLIQPTQEATIEASSSHDPTTT